MSTVSKAQHGGSPIRGGVVVADDDYRARPDDDDLVSAGEAADMMSVPIKSLYNWISRYNTTGVLNGPPFVRLDRRVKYRKGDVRRYLHDHTFGNHA